MKRVELIKHLNQWYRDNNIDYGATYLTHGGALIMHGILEETSDIDLKVSPRIWKQFNNGKFEKTILCAKGEIPETESIKVTEHIDIQLAPAHNFADLEFDRGIAYRTIPATLNDYKLLNRPKDQIRINLIENYLAIGSQ